MENNKCQICGKDMVLIPAGYSKRTNKAYGSFWACPDKCEKSRKQTQSVDTQTIIDALIGLNNRLDKMAEFLKEKLP